MLNTNDNNPYVVKCSQDIFEDVLCMVKMSGRVIDFDPIACLIKTLTLDSCLKQRLADTGASFWEQPEYATAGRR